MGLKGSSPTIDWKRNRPEYGKITFITTAVPLELAEKMEYVGAVLRAQGKIKNNTKYLVGQYCISLVINTIYDKLQDNARS